MHDKEYNEMMEKLLEGYMSNPDIMKTMTDTIITWPEVTDQQTSTYYPGGGITKDELGAATDRIKKIVTDWVSESDARLKVIEDQVLLLRRDNCMEKEFEELKEAWEAYNYIYEKLKTFKIIKDSA